MKLAAWLEAKSMTQQEFADRAGIERSYINKLLNGKCRPGVASIERMRKATDDAVRFDDWVTG